MQIKEIVPLDTFSVRHPVLRAGKPIDNCRFEGDNLVTTKHFGIFEYSQLVGVISIFKNNQPVRLSSQKFSFNKATGKKITIVTKVDKKYPGDGAFTLVNGVQNEMGMARNKASSAAHLPKLFIS